MEINAVFSGKEALWIGSAERKALTRRHDLSGRPSDARASLRATRGLFIWLLVMGHS